MKVKELIEKLSKLDGALEVLCYTEDPLLVGKSNLVKALDIADVSETKLEVSRNESGEVQLNFTGKESQRAFALIEITADL
ncbi:hypothetical protein [Methylophaga pinxianii]|uniref:hypothetical protein n=1 Tax=Methylophaga pinxianii TaxID=2881052 RepID=UPI001CF5AA54|nr:hypothetical protein [Methylophaga pinxianii]MCB2427985.1 hypothetical protein [Methylophaga pinxianii]UPH44475.1 hypothetical protein LGT42_008060 [Methylophaga pinxianii]